MKSAGIVILLPLMSVLIVSLYVHGGAARAAALILLGAGVVGAVAVFLRRRNARHDA